MSQQKPIFIPRVTVGTICDGMTHHEVTLKRDGSFVLEGLPRSCNCPAPDPDAQPVDVTKLPASIQQSLRIAAAQPAG